MPKPPGRACQEGGMHPSPAWVSALFDDGGLFLVMDVLPSYCICVARRGDLFVWRASNTDNASVRKTVGSP